MGQFVQVAAQPLNSEGQKILSIERLGIECHNSIVDSLVVDYYLLT